jgi:hypothetical protein
MDLLDERIEVLGIPDLKRRLESRARSSQKGDALPTSRGRWEDAPDPTGA